MKINGIINLSLIIAGACLLASGASLFREEYAMSIGIVVLMSGVYRATRGWSIDNSENS